MPSQLNNNTKSTVEIDQNNNSTFDESKQLMTNGGHEILALKDTPLTKEQPVYPMSEIIQNYKNNYEKVIQQDQPPPPSKPLQNLQQRVASVTIEQLQEARQRIHQFVKENESSLKFDETLILEHLEEKRIRHYLCRENSHEINMQTMLNAMKYKQETFNDFESDVVFPREFMIFKLFQISGLDRNGSPVMYVFPRHFFVKKELLNMAEPYLAYSLFRVEKLALNTSGYWTLCIDCSAASISNFDLEVFRLLIHILHSYSPAVLSKAILFNVHWLLRPIIKVLTKLIPSRVNKEILVLTGFEELSKHVAPEQMPTCLGGQRDDMLFGVPFQHSKSVLDICEPKFQFPVEKAEKMLVEYREQLEKVKGFSD